MRAICSTCGPVKVYRRHSNGFNCSRMARFSEIKRTYGLSYEQWKELMFIQNCSCGICGVKFENDNWVVDHDHNTDYVRGLLCSNCNSGIGMLGDTKSGVELALNYLTNPPFKSTVED